jgi:type IV secretion system protein VirB10
MFYCKAKGSIMKPLIALVLIFRMRNLMIFLVVATGLAWASPQNTPTASPSQQNTPATPATGDTATSNISPANKPPAPDNSATRQITVPAGTEVLLQLKNAVDTKNAHAGDSVFCQTTFPVVIDNITVIPPGTYVKGEIARVQRPGRIKGRAEVLLHFQEVIFPSGYTVEMPGSLYGDPGTAKAKIDDEGAVKSDGHDKLKKAPEAAGKGLLYGTLAGTIASGTLNGARIGGGIGAAAGLAYVLLTRGPDVRIEPGAALTMRLERPMVVDIVPSASVQVGSQIVLRQTENRLPVPAPQK